MFGTCSRQKKPPWVSPRTFGRRPRCFGLLSPFFVSFGWGSDGGLQFLPYIMLGITLRDRRPLRFDSTPLKLRLLLVVLSSLPMPIPLYSTREPHASRVPQRSPMSPFTQPATTTPSRATYLLSVDIVRPATATTPAQLVLVDAPAAPVEVGMRVALEIHIAREPEVPNEEPSDNGSEDASSGQEGPRALDTGIRGYVAYVQCLWADAVEFIIRRDGHLGEFSYLVVLTNRHGFLRFNARLYQAWLNIEPFLVPFYAAKASLDHTGVVAGEELSSYIDSIASRFVLTLRSSHNMCSVANKWCLFCGYSTQHRSAWSGRHGRTAQRVRTGKLVSGIKFIRSL